MLLVKELRKKSPPQHPENAALAEAITAMEGAANDVNHFVWVRENKLRNLKIQKTITGLSRTARPMDAPRKRRVFQLSFAFGGDHWRSID